VINCVNLCWFLIVVCHVGDCLFIDVFFEVLDIVCTFVRCGIDLDVVY